jgi:trigger factor
MQITTNKINSANAKINAAITRNTLDINIEKIAKQLSKDAKVPGFRKGKVPLDAVKKQYGERLIQDAEASALRDLLNEGLKLMDIAPDRLIGEPQITKFEKNDSGIEVEVSIATRPAIELGDYAALVPNVTKPAIADDAVIARIQELAGAQAPLVTIDENRALVNGDTALIDFEGFVDGVAFEGGKAENFSLNLGSGQFIPGFEEQVIGLSKCDEKTIDVTFPENYGGEKLAGKPASFKVKVHAIQAKEAIVLDD